MVSNFGYFIKKSKTCTSVKKKNLLERLPSFDDSLKIKKIAKNALQILINPEDEHPKTQAILCSLLGPLH